MNLHCVGAKSVAFIAGTAVWLEHERDFFSTLWPALAMLFAPKIEG